MNKAKPEDMTECYAKRCEKMKSRKMLMCATHWFIIPKKTRDLIWKYYRAKNWTSWHLTCKTARDYVEKVETFAGGKK